MDHIQLSFQSAKASTAKKIANKDYLEHKLEIAKIVKDLDFPMVSNFVIHKANIDEMQDMLELAVAIGSDFVELANTQYHGWAEKNIHLLAPSEQQLKQSEALVDEYRKKHPHIQFLYVVPDLHEKPPKACVNGWGSSMMLVNPFGDILPCHNAKSLPGFPSTNFRDISVAEAWEDSRLFNFFRGFDWMQEPCKSCDKKYEDFGGCRCQAYLLTGDMQATDPACLPLQRPLASWKYHSLKWPRSQRIQT